jgi:hypothetical protein
MEATDHWIPEADVKLPVVLKVCTSSAPSLLEPTSFYEANNEK